MGWGWGVLWGIVNHRQCSWNGGMGASAEIRTGPWRYHFQVFKLEEHSLAATVSPESTTLKEHIVELTDLLTAELLMAWCNRLWAMAPSGSAGILAAACAPK